MNSKILKRLQWASADESTFYRKGLNLCELYEPIDEKLQTEKALLEALRIHSADTDDIGKEVYHFAEACELQGFINGWRMCAMLEREFFGQSGHTEG